MIHSTIRIAINPEKSDEAVTILRMMAERTRTISGCIACRTYRDAFEGDILMFEAIWENEEDMNRQLRSDEFRNVLLAMEMAVEMPEIRFATVSHVSGMETIEKARNTGWLVE
jgi:quinol monooxygenase YgiN